MVYIVHVLPSLFHHYQTILWHIELTGKQVPCQVDIFPSGRLIARNLSFRNSALLGGYHLLSAVESSQHSYFAYSKVRFRTRFYRKTKVAKMHARMGLFSPNRPITKASTFQNTTYDTSRFRYFCHKG